MKSPYRAAKVSACVLALLLTGCPLLQTENMKKAGNTQLGSIDGIVITEDQARSRNASELESLELELLKSKAAFARDEHKVLADALEDIIREKLINDEAAGRGISSDELFNLEVQKRVEEPTAEEIEAFYKENAQRINLSKEEVVPRIRDYLKRQRADRAKEDFLKELEKNHRIVRLLGPLRFDVAAPGRPVKGTLSAPVVLVYFSDFQCSYCNAFSKTLKRVVEVYGDKVRLIYRQFPLTQIHPNAQRAAEASLCAGAQERFWEMYDLLFENSANLGEENIFKMAEQVGLDIDNFRSCVESGRFNSAIKEDIRAGAEAGVEGTPTLFVNGRYLHGNYPYEEVAQIIDEELRIKNKSE